jgi:hypothetical protein
MNGLSRPTSGPSRIIQSLIRHSSTSHEKELAKIFVFPITRDRSFLYFKYNEKLLNNNSLLVKYENKVVQGATKLWIKMRASEKSLNKNIVKNVTKFLDQIPWSEDSLRSIPSKSALLRQVSRYEGKPEESQEKQVDEITLKSAYDVTDETLVGIPVLYPSKLMTVETLSKEIGELHTQAVSYHKRQMLLTGLGIPVTLPIALVPVVPNVPGFYLAYRFYCNFKAYLGGQHLEEFSEKQELQFQDEPMLDEIYESVSHQEGELLLNEGIIESLVEKFDVGGAKTGLMKALKQEGKRLNEKL